MGEYWSRFVDFLAENDFTSLMERFRSVDLQALLANPLFWIVVIPVVILLIMRRMGRFVILGVSVVLFGLLIQQTLVPPGEVMPLSSLLKFIGGSVGLMVVNVYFMWIKG